LSTAKRSPNFLDTDLATTIAEPADAFSIAKQIPLLTYQLKEIWLILLVTAR
jgi:hypothetical protein